MIIAASPDGLLGPYVFPQANIFLIGVCVKRIAVRASSRFELRRYGELFDRRTMLQCAIGAFQKRACYPTTLSTASWKALNVSAAKALAVGVIILSTVL